MILAAITATKERTFVHLVGQLVGYNFILILLITPKIYING
jgi:hypothetical protein